MRGLWHTWTNSCDEYINKVKPTEVPELFPFVLYCCDKHYDQKQLVAERVNLSHTSTSHSVTGESQDRNSKSSSWKNAAHYMAPYWLPGQPFYTMQDKLPRVGMAPMRWVYTYQLLIKSQRFLQANSMEAIPQLIVPFPRYV